VEVGLGYYMKAFAVEKHTQFGTEPVVNNLLMNAEPYQPQVLPLSPGGVGAPLKFLTGAQQAH